MFAVSPLVAIKYASAETIKEKIGVIKESMSSGLSLRIGGTTLQSELPLAGEDSDHIRLAQQVTWSGDQSWSSKSH
jgi:hypothetical protein